MYIKINSNTKATQLGGCLAAGAVFHNLKNEQRKKCFQTAKGVLRLILLYFGPYGAHKKEVNQTTNIAKRIVGF